MHREHVETSPSQTPALNIFDIPATLHTNHMAYRAVTQDLYDSLLHAFRVTPDNITQVCRVTGAGRRIALTAYGKGYPHLASGKPIKQVLAEDAAKARAAIVAEQAAKQAQTDKDREAARVNAIRSRTEEGVMVGLARGTAVQALAMVNQCVQGGRALADQLRKSLALEAAKPEASMSPAQMIHMLGRIASLTAQLNSAAQTAMQMERLHLGEPTDVIGVVPGGPSLRGDMPLEEVELRIKAATQALEDTQRARTALTVIQGGLTGGVAETG